MSMSTALSGLMAAQTEISATSHNIANVGTVGFRSSRVEFADVFTSSPMSNQRTAVGSGVTVQRVAQDYSQGNVVTTGNLLDMAIEGQGFFAIRMAPNGNLPGGETRFTRSGAFNMDSVGRVVNASGDALLGWPVAMDGTALTNQLGQAVPMTIPPVMGAPTASAEIQLQVDLPSDDAMLGQQVFPPVAAFDADDPTTYATRTSVPMFGADGAPVEAEAYFIKISGPDALTTDTVYEVRMMVDGQEFLPTDPLVLPRVTFNAAGDITAGGALDFGPTGVTLNLGGSQLTTDPFAVQAVSHDGTRASGLSNLEVDGAGGIWATYGALGRMPVGQIAMANFTNTQGLKVQGKATFAATADSGPPIAGSAGTLGFGNLRAGALERSNVELTEELVNLISAQRNYQASAKAMETSTSLMQTVMNIRS
ncbi:MAG: flagellar hook protein FlgE [Fuscovulum sp.]|jgi:flagellar hook protein FlgE|nr:flagellar hook protein FlgE [Paracoccaceae bacterium]MCZ8084594.1 flagellar hook protein FlgE [Paracoccaceae bacterium]WRH62759.1 MAG: flagellar hook protein FlgE [Fuscovulum sp.]